MGFDVNRWLKYAKARLDAAVGSGNKKMDELEARQEADRADKPWLSGRDSDAVSPTMDQVRARIDWEAERQGVDAPRGEGGVPDRPATPPTATAEDTPAAPTAAADPADGTESGGDSGSTTPSTGPAPRAPEEQAGDAEREMARLELEARQKASAQRLDEIRKELGVEPPTGGGPDA